MFFMNHHIFNSDNDNQFGENDYHFGTEYATNQMFVYGESSWGDVSYSKLNKITTKSINEKVQNKKQISVKISEVTFFNKIQSKVNELENSFKKESENKIELSLKPYCYKFLKVTEFLYSSKSQKEIFEPMASEWEFEYFEAVKEGKLSKAKWVNLRCAYSYIFAICLKNPISDLIEFIKKIAK